MSIARYRLYRLDGANKIVGQPIDIEAANDDEAHKEATRLHHVSEVEIWCGARRVKPSG